jgi:DNA-binding LacI/PurR family transcriptional regulator
VVGTDHRAKARQEAGSILAAAGHRRIGYRSARRGTRGAGRTRIARDAEAAGRLSAPFFRWNFHPASVFMYSRSEPDGTTSAGLSRAPIACTSGAQSK